MYFPIQPMSRRKNELDASFDMERCIFLYNPCLEGKISWDASFDMKSYRPMVDEVPFNSRKRGKVRRNPIVMKRNPIEDLVP